MKYFRALLPLAALLAAACGVQTPQQPDREPSSAAAAVEVEAVRLERRADAVESVGTVEARRAFTVAARIMAYVRRVRVEEGQRVRKGQRLIDLDDRDLRSAVEAARAAEAEAESAIRAAAESVEAARAGLDLAETTFQRYETLLAKQSLTRQEFDQAEARLKQARAAHEAAKSQKSRAEAKRAQAEAGIASAETMLDFGAIDSPVDGVVVERLEDPGALAAPGGPLLRIEEARGYRLEAAVPESSLSRVRVGQKVGVEIDALGAAGRLEAKIVQVTPAVDPRSRTFLVKLALPPIPGLRSGLFGRALLPGTEREILTVPQEAVLDRGQLQSVMVVREGIARRRLVKLGARLDARFVVESGLTAGEEVILDPAGVADGAPVALRSRGGGR